MSRGTGLARLQAGARRLPGPGPVPVRPVRRSDWKVATERQPTEREWNDLRFAWAAVAPVKSNAILLARDEAAIGIGAGQMSRVDSVFLAVHKARQQGHDPAGSVLASDGFFPFADGVEQAAGGGRDRHHPARRLGARRRSRRGRQPARHGDGHDRPPPVPTLAHGSHDRSTPQERPPYLLGPRRPSPSSSLIYLATLAPTTAFWDTSEYIAAAKVLGIPHPPGNPLFVILAHMFGLLPLAASLRGRGSTSSRPSPARRAAGLWFLVAERWLRGIVPDRWARYAAAFGGVLVGATSWTVWNQSHGQREGVHRLAALDRAGDVAGGPLGRRRARHRTATAGWCSSPTCWR